MLKCDVCDDQATQVGFPEQFAWTPQEMLVLCDTHAASRSPLWVNGIAERPSEHPDR